MPGLLPSSHSGDLTCPEVTKQTLQPRDLPGGRPEFTPKLELLFLEFLNITLACLENDDGN